MNVVLNVYDITPPPPPPQSSDSFDGNSASPSSSSSPEAPSSPATGADTATSTFSPPTKRAVSKRTAQLQQQEQRLNAESGGSSDGGGSSRHSGRSLRSRLRRHNEQEGKARQRQTQQQQQQRQQAGLFNIVNFNTAGRQLNLGGLFHGAIQLGAVEWAFGYCDTGTGVYCCAARRNPMYTFREAIDLGATPKTELEIRTIIQRIRQDWQGASYDLLARNCCHFCIEFSKQLEVKAPPGWLNRLAYGADTTIAFTNETIKTMRNLGNEVSRQANGGLEWMRQQWMRGSKPAVAQSSHEQPIPDAPNHNVSASLLPRMRFNDGKMNGNKHASGSEKDACSSPSFLARLRGNGPAQRTSSSFSDLQTSTVEAEKSMLKSVLPIEPVQPKLPGT